MNSLTEKQIANAILELSLGAVLADQQTVTECLRLFDEEYSRLETESIEDVSVPKHDDAAGVAADRFTIPHDIPIYALLMLLAYKLAKELVVRIGTPIAKSKLRLVVKSVLRRFEGKLDPTVLSEIEENLISWLDKKG